MEFQYTFFAPAGKGIHASVIPYVTSVATMSAKLDIIQMWLAAIPEYEYKFVPRAIERPHPAVALDPDAQVQKVEASDGAGGRHGSDVVPVHAGIDHGA